MWRGCHQTRTNAMQCNAIGNAKIPYFYSYASTTFLLSYIRHKDFLLCPPAYVLRQAQGTPQGFCNGLDWRALVKDKFPHLAQLRDFCWGATQLFFLNFFKVIFQDFWIFFLFIFDNFWNFRILYGFLGSPKMGQNSMISPFFARRAKKALALPKPSAGARSRPA